MRNIISKVFTLLTILTLFVGQAWAAYYTPTADEVIVLPDIYNSSKTDAGYSDHSAITWGATGTTNSKKAGDPDNSGAATSANKTCYSVKNNGAGKRITLSISGCSGLIIYRQTDNLTRYVNLLATPDGESQTTISGSVCASPYFAHDYTLDGSKSYTIVLQGTQTGSDQQDVYVYAIKLIKATGGGDPVDVTGISISPSPAAVKVGKTVALTATITPNDATDKTVTWSIKSGSTYASVDASTGVVTGLAEGTAVITATANDGSGVTEDVTVNVSACPTSGTLFSMVVTDPDGTVYTDVTDAAPQQIGATYSGGKAYATSTSSSKRSPKITGDEFDFNVGSGGSVAVKVELDCSLAEGDIISFTSTHDKNFYIRKVVGTDLHTTSALSLEIPAGSALIGEDVFYVMRTNSACSFSEINIIRPVYRTITLEYADGATPDGSLDVIDGTAASQPADPTWAHHRFDGWYNGASPYDWSATVSGDLTLTAHWTQLYTITYAAGDGTATGDAPTQVDKAAGETFEVAANTFAVAGKDFDKWNDGANDYAPGDTYTMDAANVVLTAIWKAAADKYTVIFKDGETTLDTKLVEVGSNPSDAGVDKTKALSTFAAWQKDAADIALDDAFWATVVKDATVTLTARWTKAYATDVDFETEAVGHAGDEDYAKSIVDAHNYALSTKTGTTFDENTSTNNGAYLGLKIKNAGTTLSWNVVAGKVVELKAGVMVANGSLTINGGAATTIDGGSTASGDNFLTHYFYSATEALYVFTTSNGSAEVIKAITMRDPYTVSFDVNGGDDPIADMTAMPSITLPTPTKGSESFLGWFDALDNFIGNAGDTYAPEATIELVAHWESVSTDARLSEITFSAAGTLSPAFDPEVVNYTYTMPYGTAAVPTITGATAVNANAQAPVIDAQAAAWNETAIIRGVAQSGDSKAYNITMKMAPKDGVSIIKVATTGSTNKTVTGLYAGDGDVNLSSSKKMDNGKYIGFTLAGTTLQVGDQINVHTSTAANTGGSHIIFYDNMTDKNELYETGEIGGLGDNIFTINAAMVGQVSAYVYRSNADAAHQWNGYVDFIEVTRAITPMLTAITINGQAGVIDEGLKTVAVELQPGYDLAALTIVPTIVSNTDEALVVKTVESNGGNWIIGDNTYRLTDKDGDYTDYTVTLSVGEVKHTVTFDAQGGSAVDPQQVVDGGNPAVPTAPTKDDYIFQGWSETTDGAVVDVTSFTITAPKTFYAIWVSDGAIKLLDGSTVNHTNFITGVTADETVEFQGNTVNYAKFSGTVSAVSGVKDLTRVIAYNATTTQTKIKISAHNNSTSARSILVKGLVEGADAAVDLATIDLGNKEDKVSDWITFDNAANRTIYIFVPSSAGDVYFTQVKVIESGATPMKSAGQVGYSINLNKGRIFGVKETDHAFEGATYNLSSDYTALNTGYAKIKSSSISFDVASPVLMTVTTTNNKTYYVTEGSAGTDNETAKTGASEFSLTAGTWYITGDAAAEVQITNIAFSAPKCEQPTITTQPATKIDFPAGDMTATVVAEVSDGGTLSYQWYNASDDSEVTGADEATLTTTTEGTYYVIVTNSLADHADNFIKSDNATLGYIDLTDATLSALSYGGTPIALSDGVYEYDVNLPEGTTDVPVLAATATMAAYGATAVPTDAAAFVSYEATSTVLVTAADHTTTQTYTVNFHVDHLIAALVDVSTDMTWDFSKANDGTAAGSSLCTDAILANVAGIVNNANFESDNIMATANKFKDGKLQASMIKFHTTINGIMTVVFSNTGSKTTERYLVVNGVKTEAGSKTETAVTYTCFVPAGDVVLTVVDGDGNMLNFTSIDFVAKAAPDYTRSEMLGNGVLGTICLPNNVPAGQTADATFYELVGKNGDGKIVFAEATGELVAGKPYVFKAKGDNLALYYGSTSVTEPDNSGALKGTFAATTIANTDPNWANIYYFANHALYSCSDLTSLNLPANRAYLVMSEVGSYSPKPGRRYIALDVNGKTTPTGVENLENGEAPVKMMIDGQLFILRGEKMYDATGRLVK